MGNHHSSSTQPSRKPSLARTNSGVDIGEKSSTIFAVEKLAKILSQKSSEEDSVQGITCRAFSRRLFPRYPELGLRVFGYLHYSSGSTTVDRISVTQFKAQVDKLLCVITDDALISVYVKMFAACGQEIGHANFSDLIMTAYRLAMDHYVEGPQTCIHIHRTIQSVVYAAFHRKDVVPIGFAGHWIQDNCPHLVTGIHKFVVHVLTTAYRTAGLDSQTGLELSTPVLDKIDAIEGSKFGEGMPLSLVWLLTSSLPLLYAKPQQVAPSSNGSPFNTAQNVLLKMMGSEFPSHWLPLYDSNAQGFGSNRFLTHVLNYRGPTLTFLSDGGNFTFLIATGMEWRESHQYWGGSDCVLMQISPEYHVIERGEKLVYLNCSIRGYPMGIRAGSDPRNPSIIVDGDFSHVMYKKIPYQLERVEVWGCGKVEQREAQLEVKKWQVKEAEKQRVVKLNAEDWVNHPDRYLLELNGRAVYNSTAS